MKLGILGIQPLRQMPPGNQMNFSDPWSILFNTTKPIFQQIPISISLLTIILLIGLLILPSLSAPRLIGTVHPCDHKINFFPYFIMLHFNPHFYTAFNTLALYPAIRRHKLPSPIPVSPPLPKGFRGFQLHRSYLITMLFRVLFICQQNSLF